MVHAAMARSTRRGTGADDARAAPVALIGDLLATQAKAQGAAALLVDGRFATSRSCRDGAADLGALGPRPRRRQDGRRGDRESVTVGGALISQGDLLVLDADGVAVVEVERVDEVLAASRSAREREEVSGPNCRRASCRSSSMGCASESEAASRDRADPRPRSDRPWRAADAVPGARVCGFFTDLFGMEIEHREGQSVFLRGWGEYQPYGAETDRGTVAGHRSGRDPRPEPRGARPSRRGGRGAGLGIGWTDGDHGHGPAYGSPTPTATPSSSSTSRSATFRRAPAASAEERAAALRRPRRRRQAVDHVNLLAADVTAGRRVRRRGLGFRLYEQVILDDGRRPAPGSA